MARRFIFEHHHQPLLPFPRFVRRMLKSAALAIGLLSITILLGAAAYHSFEHQSWIDAVLNAVSIMSGLGVIGNPTTFAGKLFTVIFALCSAFAFYAALAILFTPLLHRFLHHFHLITKKDEQ